MGVHLRSRPANDSVKGLVQSAEAKLHEPVGLHWADRCERSTFGCSDQPTSDSAGRPILARSEAEGPGRTCCNRLLAGGAPSRQRQSLGVLRSAVAGPLQVDEGDGWEWGEPLPQPA